jgi:VanZ family protein
MIDAQKVRLIFGSAGLLLVPLLIYASILPLQFVPLPLDQAIIRWQSTPWLNLGVNHRADWIFNAIVIIPITYFLCGAVGYRRRLGMGLVTYYGCTAFLLGFIVFGIEFLQIWFPRRTVSYNDIFAGCIGSGLGVIFWILIGTRTTDLFLRFLDLKSFTQRLLWFSITASLGSLLYTLFPFDFVFTKEELQSKFLEGRIGIGLPKYGLNVAEILKGLLVSFLRMIPFGVALGARSLLPKNDAHSFFDRFLGQIGYIIVFGLSLEVLQIPIYSKYASVCDCVAGILGGWLGFSSVRSYSFWGTIRHRPVFWLASSFLWILILYTAYISLWPFGYGRVLLTDDDMLRTKWGNFITPPFRNYYFPSEYNALTSAFGKMLSFGGLGFFFQGYLESKNLTWSWSRFSAIVSGSAILGFLIEVSQIYISGQVADTTDVFIYSAGTFLGMFFLHSLYHGLNHSSDLDNDLPMEHDPLPTSRLLLSALSLVFMIFGVTLSVLHPGWPVFQTLAVWFVAGIVYLRQDLYPCLFILFLILADAYLWTGQSTVQEYDSLLMGATSGLLFAAAWSKDLIRTARYPLSRSDVVLRMGWAFLLLSFAISFFVGIYRLPAAPWGDQLSVYFTKWNALRIVKGVFWGCNFLFCFAYLSGSKVNLWPTRLSQGFVSCSLYVGIWVLLERAIFPGLGNLKDIYRATGPFFTMHIGDQHIDGFLVLALPMTVAMITMELDKKAPIRNSHWLAVCFASLFLICHAIFATMSRGTVLAVVAQGLVVLGLGIWRNSTRGLSKSILISIPLVVMLGAVFYSTFWVRFSSSVDDGKDRMAHWRLIIDRGTTGIGGLTIGHGLGTFPSMMASEKNRPIPPVSWGFDGQAGFIEMRQGWPLFLERFEPPEESFLNLSATNQMDGSVFQSSDIGLYRAEKSLLHSYGYIQKGLEIRRGQTLEVDWPREMHRDASDRNPMANLRPTFIGLGGPSQGTVKLTASKNSSELVSMNSSYPWIYTCDDHLVWRAKNFLVHAYYEQGLLGVMGWVLLVLAATAKGLFHLSERRSSSRMSPWFSCSILGFVIVAMFGTLVDTPWITASVLALLGMHNSRPSMYPTVAA